MGPTASGKTDIAAKLTEHFPIDLISVDAAQVYRGMNIGTAKPDADFLAQYPHQLINIRDPQQNYSAADFVKDDTDAIHRSHAKGNIPLLVGVTLFYYKALESGLSDLPAANPELRRGIEKEIEASGVHKVHEFLKQVDPRAADRIDPNDRQRVQRALEIYRETGYPPSELMDKKTGLQSPMIKITLFTPDRRLLHQRIATRFSQMVEQGLVEEVRGIIEASPSVLSAPSMRTVGYRQVIPFLDQEISLDQMIANSIAATRQLAKRQMTWLRQQSGVTWIEGGGEYTLSATCEYLSHHFLMPEQRVELS